MTEQKIAQKILERIEQDHIKPRARWKFLLKDYVVWSVGFGSLVIGSLSVSVVMFTMTNSEWDVRNQVNENILEFVFITLPYLWLLVFGFFLLVAYYNFSHTKSGYRYSLAPLVFGNLVLCLVFGGVFYSLGLGHLTDSAVAKGLPLYKGVVEKRQQKWSQPQDGFLAGSVVVVIENDEFQVRDFQERTWKVVRRKEPTQMTNVDLQAGNEVRLIGKLLDNKTFEVCQIRPWIMKGNKSILTARNSDDESYERIFHAMRSIDCGPRKTLPSFR